MANSTADGSVVIDVNMDVSQAEKRLGKLRDNIKKTEKEIADATTARDEAQKKLDNSPLEQEQKKLQDMMAARKKAAEVESSLVPISKEISDLEAKLSEQQQNRLRTEENIKKTKDAIISAEKELSILESSPKNNERYKKRVEELNEFLRVARPAVGNMGTNLDLYNREIQNAVASLDQLKERADKISLGNPETVVSNEEVKSQEEKIKTIQDEWKATQKDVERYTAQIEKANEKLGEQKTEAGILTQEIDRASKSQGLFEKSADESGKAMTRFNRRIVELVKSAFIFNVISAGLRSIQQITMKYIKTNDEARQAIAQLKGALLTLAQPLVSIIIPAFTKFVNILTRAITLLSAAFSSLFGKTASQSAASAKSLYEQQKALEGVASAADKASGSLAGFDEINTIQTESPSSGAASTEIVPDFSAVDTFKGKLDELMVYISGALLALGAILFFSGANIPLGLGLMVLGAAMLAQEIKENWGAADGKVRDAVNRMLIIIGGALLVIGAILCFSGANIPLGLGLMVVGAAMLATAAKLNWGELGEETRKAITDIFIVIGTFLIVLGAIIALSGANIPLGIGLMIAGAASLTAAAVLDWDYFSSHIKEIVTTITVLLGASLLVLGAILAFSGANILLGIGLMVVGAASLAAAVALNWNSIVAAIQGPFGKIMAIVSGALLVLGIILCCCGILPLGIALIAVGAVGLVTVTVLNWNAILDKIKSVFNDIKSWWNKNAAKYFTLDYWKNKGNDIIDGFKAGIKEKWDGLTKWFSGIWNDLFGNKKVSVGVSGSSSAGNYNSGPRMAARSIPEISPQNIPRLAQGAVIPPNREFMAVLGDQRNGTNLEAPEDLIRKIVREESGGGNAELVQLLQSILSAVKEGHIIMVDGSVFGRTAIKTINSVNTSAGKQLLLI